MLGGSMQAVAGSERRQHIRKQVEIEVFLTCDEKDKQGIRVAVHDISLSGMAIYPGTLKLQLDDTLYLCFSGPGGECSQEHIIAATVVHLRQGMVGMRFDSIGVSVLNDLHQLLRDERVF